MPGLGRHRAERGGELNGAYPIRTTLTRIAEPVIRCCFGEEGGLKEYRDCAEILQPAFPGDPFAIPRTALQMTGIFQGDKPLAAALEGMGGGLQIRTEVDLPMGSGLGTSSILAATVLRAFSEMLGSPPDDQSLSDQVMRLEQLMTTGGGWQDQAGGIFSGRKVVISAPAATAPAGAAPGMEARAGRGIRIPPGVVLHRDPAHRARFTAAGGGELPGPRYRDRAGSAQHQNAGHGDGCYAMQEGDWTTWASLLDHHWKLNQILDPNTTNAPINTLLAAVRPYIRGVKLAGAGGGGFLMLLARSPAAARDLRSFLADSQTAAGGAVYAWRMADDGLRLKLSAAAGGRE